MIQVCNLTQSEQLKLATHEYANTVSMGFRLNRPKREQSVANLSVAARDLNIPTESSKTFSLDMEGAIQVVRPKSGNPTANRDKFIKQVRQPSMSSQQLKDLIEVTQVTQ